MSRLFKLLRELWEEEDNQHMKGIAERYAQRAWMDGDTIKKTGEVISREST